MRSKTTIFLTHRNAVNGCSKLHRFSKLFLLTLQIFRVCVCVNKLSATQSLHNYYCTNYLSAPINYLPMVETQHLYNFLQPHTHTHTHFSSPFPPPPNPNFSIVPQRQSTRVDTIVNIGTDTPGDLRWPPSLPLSLSLHCATTTDLKKCPTTYCEKKNNNKEKSDFKQGQHHCTTTLMHGCPIISIWRRDNLSASNLAYYK